MKPLHPLAAAGLALVFCSCATTSVERTWKSPGPTPAKFQKVAVLGIEERAIIRQIFEGQFATQMGQFGQAALRTHETLSLPAIKEDRDAAAARLREGGADAILIVRLVDSKTRSYSIRETSAAFVPVATGIGSYYGWYDYYSVAFVDMSVVRNSLQQDVYLETTLFDLKTGRALWSGLTRTTLKEDTDVLPIFRPLVAKVLAALRKDGFFH